MPHKCRDVWGPIADELAFTIWGQAVAANYVSGWGARYDDPMAYSACVTLLDQLNAALGTDPAGPPQILDYQPGQFPAGEIASLSLLMGEGLHYDQYDDNPPQNDRHSRMGFPWVETNAGNVPNAHKPDLEDLRRRIRDILEPGRTPAPMPVELRPGVHPIPMGMPHDPPDPDAPPEGRPRRAKFPLVPSWRPLPGGGKGVPR